MRINNFILNNGVKIPLIGFGVFRITDEAECEEAVYQAIMAGYRLIDTAAAYGNEEAVGRAIRRSGVSREELFISTKLWIPDTSYEGAKQGLSRSLARLGLDYADLYCIHQPYHDVYGAWRALEELYAAGKVRAIGVDNFTEERLADFLHFQNIKPAVNLLECNAFYQRTSELDYMNSHGVQMLAWSPLAAGKGQLFENEVLRKIADIHGKSVAQIVLRWLVQRGIIPLVKSTNPARMRENLAIFDFALTPEEMREIAQLDTGHSMFPPRTSGNAVEEFLNAAGEINI